MAAGGAGRGGRACRRRQLPRSSKDTATGQWVSVGGPGGPFSSSVRMSRTRREAGLARASAASRRSSRSRIWPRDTRAGRGPVVEVGGEVADIAGGEAWPLVAVEDLDEGAEGIDRSVGHGVFLGRIAMARGVERDLELGQADAEGGGEGGEVVVLEGFRVRKAVFVVHPDPEGGLGDVEDLGERAAGEFHEAAAPFDEFLERGVWLHVVNGPPTGRDLGFAVGPLDY